MKKRKRIKLFLIGTVLLLLVGLLVGNWYVKRAGYDNIFSFFRIVTSNYSKGTSAKYETLSIKIDPVDFEKLKSLRAKALKRGIQINEENGFVDATLKHNGKKIKAKLRLKGHMTDHLEDKKWSFRIHTKKGDAFMGMKMFSLQNPGTRNYIYEWIYHQLMHEKNIVSLRYDFIKLMVNNEDWGIYALEENFGQQLIQHNQRIKGPIVRFDPELYWVSRINELDKVRINEEYAGMQSAFVDVYDESNVFKDSALLNRYNQAVRLVESFRRGNLSTSQVFDIKKLAYFHAIIDLIGGHHSIDWSDIKYYFNPETNLLEPVAYESFSINPVGQLSAAYRFSNAKVDYINDWHTALFSDVAFFNEYIHCLDSITSPQWLKGFFKRNKAEMDNKVATLCNEFYGKEFKTDLYFQNQVSIKHLLGSPSGFIAYFKQVNQDTLYLQVGGVDALPYEIKAIKVNGKSMKLKSKIIVDPKGLDKYVKYRVIQIPITDSKLLKDINSTSKIVLNASIVGSSNDIEQKVQMITLPDEKPYHFEASTISDYPFLSVDGNVIHVLEGTHEISKTLVIPKNKLLKIGQNTKIIFDQGAGIISYSPIQIKGNEDFPVRFQSKDGASGFLTILNSKEQKSNIEHAIFEIGGKFPDTYLASQLRIYNSNVELHACVFMNEQVDLLRLTGSKVLIDQCQFSGKQNCAVKINYSSVELVNTSIVNTKVGIDASGSKIVCNSLTVKNASKTGVFMSENAYLQANQLSINKCNTGLLVRDKSDAKIIGFDLSSNQVALKADKKGDVFGPSTIAIRNLKESGNKVLQEVEKGSSIQILK